MFEDGFFSEERGFMVWKQCFLRFRDRVGGRAASRTSFTLMTCRVH